MRILFLSFLFITSFVTAQVTDNFTDGDFTSNPVWSGDAAEFIVNTSQQLQLNNTVAGASYLSAASPTSSLNNIEWRFYIKQTFSPSSSNYGRVYLASDQANLEGSLNGYYLQFGEALSNDAVELFSQTGLTSTSVARCTNGQIATSFAIGVKVTRNASGVWSLYVDPTGGTAYAFEISGTDNTHTTTNFFGVASVYTVGNITKFFFDDFYNGAIVVDVTPPSIVSSTVISATQVDVLFNENVQLATAQTLTNYSVNNGLGNPTVALRDAVNLSLVHLTFATAFTSGLANTLTVTNVQDFSANAITTANTNFTYFISFLPSFKDIIITEIFADPSPQLGLPAVEFIEIYNRSTTTINLNGWKFTDGSSNATLSSYNLLSNQYLIICSAADTALFTPFGNRMGVSSFPSLNNTGDKIYLKDNTLAFIDSVGYSDTWYQDATKKAGGWSLELINPTSGVNCLESTNWIASNNVSGGTPGTQNSVYSLAADITAPTISSVTVVDSIHINVCFSEALDASQISVLSNYTINNGIGTPIIDTANSTLTCAALTLGTPLVSSTTYTLTLTNMADCSGNALSPAFINFSAQDVPTFGVVINEIMADPDPVVGLPNHEYAELYNKTAFPINLTNWSITIGTTIKVFPNITILADSFLVLTSTGALPDFSSTIATVGFSSFSLTNSEQTITLKNPQGAVISSVSYSDQWYHDAIKKNGGWSLEQIDPNNPCAGIDNWRASFNTLGGTPGTLNSTNGNNPDNAPPEVLRVAVIATDTIQIYFNEPLDSTTMLNLAIYSIDNGLGSPIQLSPIAPDFKSVRLALSSALQIGTIYTITINNAVTDCAGNAVGLNNTARFALPEPALPNDIVINEILVDPKTDGVDFVEIYNRSNKVIDLKTMTISLYDTVNNILTSISAISNESYLIFPHEYLVLSEDGAIVKSQYTTTNPKGFLDTNLPTMSIAGGTVCLATNSAIIDLLKYYDFMQFPLLSITKGVSLERLDFNRPTQDNTNWHSAAQDIGFATPAYKNSQYNDAGETDDAIEIMPEVFSPDEDGFNDIVNINYRFETPGFIANITIYDSKGRIVRYLVRSELLGLKGTYSWDGITGDREKARIGIYIIFFEVFDLSGNVKQYKKTCVVAGKI
ncbi:MAG: lamin tail domain-containing protein [Bacteroidota bacterium]